MAKFYDVSVASSSINSQFVLLLTNAVFAISFLLVDFVPVYKKNPYLFPGYFPIKNYEKSLATLFFYSFKYYVLFVLCVYLGILIYSANFGIIYFFYSILFAYCGFVINRIIKNITEYSVPERQKVAYILIVTVGVNVLYLYQFGGDILIDFVFVCLSFLLLFYCFTKSEVNKKLTLGNNKLFDYFSSDNFYFSLLGSKNLSRTYLPAFIFKIIWLLVIAISLQSDGEPPFDNYKSVWLFASPLLILLYTGTNFFGQVQNLFFSHIIREHNIKNLINIYLGTVGILILIDSFIFLLFIFFSKLYQLENIVFYCSLVILLSFIGFISSLYKPSFVNSSLFLGLGNAGNKGDIQYEGVIVLIVFYFIIEWAKYSNYQLSVTALLLVIFLTFALFYKVDFSFISHSSFYQLKKE
jgi:hypothetical protein